MNMDKTLTALVDCALGVPYTAGGVASTVRHVLDAVACIIGGYREEPGAISRRIAATGTSAAEGASVFGMAQRTIPEYAALANSVMCRSQDWNDAGPDGHLADMIPAVLAAGEHMHSSGPDLIRATYAMYEVRGAITSDLRSGHLDRVYSALGTAVGAGLLYGLSREQLGNAISMALVPNISLRVTRSGSLSHWKSVAGPYGCMNGVMAARLAREGMTGPEEPFEGVDGFYELIGRKLDLTALTEPVDGKSVMERTAFKYYPSEHGSQGPLDLILGLRRAGRIAAGNVEQIIFRVAHATWLEIGGGMNDYADKWDPKTRETADHSLAYIIAVALTDGEITPQSFAMERVGDQSLRPLMKRIAVVSDPEITKIRLQKNGPRITELEVIMKDGGKLHGRISNPREHPNPPMTDAELESKFRAASRGVIAAPLAQRYLDTLWGLEQVKDINQLTDLFRAAKVE